MPDESLAMKHSGLFLYREEDRPLPVLAESLGVGKIQEAGTAAEAVGSSDNHSPL